MKKTRRGLERRLKTMRETAIFFLVIFAIACIGLLIIIGQYNELKTQLSECEDDVEVWNLKVVCYQTNLSYSSWNIFETNVYWDRITFENNFTNYEDYTEKVKWFKRYDRKWKEVRDCEVMK